MADHTYDGEHAPPRAGHLAAVTLSGVVTGLAVAFMIIPGIRERLIVEDGYIEWLTAVTFLAAAVFGTGVTLRRPSLARVYWMVPLVGALGFLDEMSFGTRIFGFPLPVVDGVEVDSFHDILDLTNRFAGDIGIRGTHMAAVALLVVGAAAVLILRRGLGPYITSWFGSHRPIMLALGTLGFLAAGMALDLIGSTTPARFAEETCEFIGSGLLLVAAAVMSDEAKSISTATSARMPAAMSERELG